MAAAAWHQMASLDEVRPLLHLPVDQRLRLCARQAFLLLSHAAATARQIVHATIGARTSVFQAEVRLSHLIPLRMLSAISSTGKSPPVSFSAWMYWSSQGRSSTCIQRRLRSSSARRAGISRSGVDGVLRHTHRMAPALEGGLVLVFVCTGTALADGAASSGGPNRRCRR